MSGFQKITALFMTTLFQAGGLDLLPKSVIGFSHCNKLIHVSVFMDKFKSAYLLHHGSIQNDELHFYHGWVSLGRTCLLTVSQFQMIKQE